MFMYVYACMHAVAVCLCFFVNVRTCVYMCIYMHYIQCVCVCDHLKCSCSQLPENYLCRPFSPLKNNDRVWVKVRFGFGIAGKTCLFHVDYMKPGAKPKGLPGWHPLNVTTTTTLSHSKVYYTL